MCMYVNILYVQLCLPPYHFLDRSSALVFLPANIVVISFYNSIRNHQGLKSEFKKHPRPQFYRIKLYSYVSCLDQNIPIGTALVIHKPHFQVIFLLINEKEISFFGHYKTMAHPLVLLYRLFKIRL